VHSAHIAGASVFSTYHTGQVHSSRGLLLRVLSAHDTYVKKPWEKPSKKN
jgi:hypothetical protein